MNTDPTTTAPRELVQRYKRAFGLVNRPVSDYHAALPLLVDCVARDPYNLIFVETFLQVLGKIEPSRGKLRCLLQRLAFRRAVARHRDEQVARLGPGLLALRPRDARVLCGMAETCARQGHDDVSLRYARTAADAQPDDPRVQRCFAECCTRCGLMQQAAAAWERVVRQQPHDTEARESAAKLGEYTVGGDSRAQLPPPSWEPSDPADTPRALEKAKTLLQRSEFAQAQTILTSAVQANPGDLRIREMIEDLDLAQAHRWLDVARRQGSPTIGGPGESLADRLENDLLRREIAIFGGRANRYPDEHRWSLQLAGSLKRSGNFAEACRTLESIPSHSPQRPEADLEFGECLQYLHRFDRALASYEDSIRRFSPDALSRETGLLALYRAGALAMDLGDADKAIGYLQRLANLAADYKDVGRRLDKLEQIRHKD